MKKTIKIDQIESGSKYFYIYEVRVEKYDGERLTYGRYLSEKEAEESAEFAKRVHAKRYSSAWVMREIVWC